MYKGGYQIIDFSKFNDGDVVDPSTTPTLTGLHDFIEAHFDGGKPFRSAGLDLRKIGVASVPEMYLNFFNGTIGGKTGFYALMGYDATDGLRFIVVEDSDIVSVVNVAIGG